MARFSIKSGNHAGQVFELRTQIQQVGRGTKNDIRLTDACVSRQHADIVRRESGEYFIRDKGSTFGTFVNNRKISEVDLADGMELRIGEVQVEFIDEKEDRTLLPKDDRDRDRIESDTGEYTILHSLALEEIVEEKDSDNMQSAKERLQTALKVSTYLSSATKNIQQIFDVALEQVLKATKARNAGILLWDPDTEELDLVAGLGPDNNGQPVEYSGTIVRRVARSGESLLTEDVTNTEGMSTSVSMVNLEIKSAMCVPLRHEDAIIGALNVDSAGMGVFTRDDLHLMTILGNIAGTAIVNSRLHEENVRAERLAAIGQSMAGLAHDIKNIMSGIKGGSYMVDQGVEGNDQTMLTLGWDLVRSSQDRINQLVLNMLDWSKERKPRYETVDLLETLGNVRDLAEARGREKSVEATLDVGDGEKEIEAEGISVHRCVLNLTSNALDALPDDRPGKIEICTRSDEKEGFIAIDVRDNGTGIPEDILPTLFLAFSSSKGSKGTGLGLAVSRKIAREHGGDITIKTAPDLGTTFTIHLPRKKPGE